ncbi:MAG TPA: DUF2142 domain-containing protein [Thermoanaerobaculia bacterium]|nr:DUF2142 domain-containing protein [Thermoanaerobaculia bacterium]
MSKERHLVAVWMVALLTGLAYAILTPPDRVPDEFGHFYRALAIAEGDFFPPVGYHAPGHHFPKGIHMFAYRIRKDDLSARYTLSDLKAALAEPLNREKRAGIEFGAWYSPAPYVVHIAVSFAGLHLGWRPFWIFYVGRIANLIACISIVIAAMLLVPRRSAVIAVVLLLPMTLYQLASWSADAMTICAAILMTSLIVRNLEEEGVVANRELATLAGVALFAGLCKPAYFLLVLPVAAVPTHRFGSVARRVVASIVIVGAMTLGTLLSVANTRAEQYNPRWDLPVDPAQQLRCIANDPLHFAKLVLNDLYRNGISYLGQTAGRLGMADVKLPKALLLAEWLLLFAVAITSGVRWTMSSRLTSVIVCVTTILGISLSQYLVWSVLCSDEIGVQGRYYLPIVPLALFTFSARRAERRISPLVIALIGVVANVIALFIIVDRYWS